MRNIYDNSEFFAAYAEMGRSKDGLKAAGEWHQLQPLFPKLQGKKVLDLGCGYGWHCKYAAQMGATEILGIDSSQKMIAKAVADNSDDKIKYKVCGVEEYIYPENTYDLVVSNLVLHYIENLANVYQKVYCTLKVGGYFLFNIEHPTFTAGVNEDWIYDENGKPLEGVYVDLNGDGIINQLDLYRYKSPAPKWLAGFSSYLKYKNWDLNIAGRFSFGNYVYNNVQSNGALYSRMYDNTGFYSNIPTAVSKTNFREAQYFSDYYVQNASFMKLDNITLGYNFQKLWKNRIDLRVFAIMQNVFTITRYKGLDPEIFNGIDNNVYPRPRTFLVGVNLGF